MFNDTYSTSDIYEAAFLLSKGLKRKGKEDNDGRTNIIFHDRKKCEELSLEFFDGKEHNICAKDYADSYRIIKKYIFQ